MPAGVFIANDFGSVQIDQDWRNYGFRQIIPIYLETQSAFNYELHVTGEAPLVAARSASLAAVPLQSYTDGAGNWYFTFRIFAPFVHGVTYGETIQFYIFDVLPTLGFSSVGLEVFDAAGLRVFHSDMQVMKIRSVQACSVPFFGVSGRIYAPLYLINPVRSEFTPGFGYGVSTRALRHADPNIITTDRFTGYGGFTSEYANDGLYAAVDVTGLS